MPDQLIEPHGGELVTLLADPERAEELTGRSTTWPSWRLTPRQRCDLELLLSGGFSPLRGFLGRADYEAVCAGMRLADGTLWPIPVTLDLPAELASALGPGASLALRDDEGVLLAALHVEEVWRPDRRAEAQAVFGSTDVAHPGVAGLLEHTYPCYLAGELVGVAPPRHYDYRDLRRTPAQLRAEFDGLGWRRVAAFPTQRPMHRAQLEATQRAALAAQASLLIHAVVDAAGGGEVDRYSRMRCYQATMAHYPRGIALLSVLPLARLSDSPRKTLWQAIIAKNHGASHLIGAEGLTQSVQDELGMAALPAPELVYVADLDAYLPEDEVPPHAHTLSISDSELRRRLDEGAELPAWFTPPAVAAELRRSHPPRSAQGVTVFFTGLSGSGKSTIAGALMVALREIGGRPVTLLDGDLVRTHLSSELGFSKAHRDLNIRRIGFVAAEITKNGGIAICAPIAPYDATRRDVRAMVEAGGGFLLVYVATALAVCEQRDRKGLYAKARAGLVAEFTGISDPYEEPTDADLVVDTGALSPEQAVQEIVLHLQRAGYLTSTSP